MVERSQIYIRYNVNYMRGSLTENPEAHNYKGLIARYFQWNHGERMVRRARYVIESIKDEFPGCIDSHWNWDFVENIIDSAVEHNNVSKDQLCYFVSDMLPEVEFLEVARFCENGILTNSTLKELGREF